MTDNAIHPTIWAWLVAASGYAGGKVYRADQNGPDLWPDNYITYKIITRDAARHADRMYVDPGVPGDTSTRYITRTVVTVSVNVYAEDGAERLTSIFGLARYSWVCRQILLAADAALLDMGTIRDLTRLTDTGHRPRFQADFVFNWTTSVTVSDNTVDVVEINGIIEGDEVEIVSDTGREYPDPPEEEEEED
jgi:hypothetical protein